MKDSTPNREEFRKSLRKLIEENDFRVGKLTPDALIIATPVEEFDMKSNDLWEIPANKSFPRDVFCRGCNRQMVMSDGIFKDYEENGRKNPVMCIKDALAESVKEEAEAGIKSS